MRAAAAVLALLLGACARPDAAPPPQDMAGEMECDAAAVQRYVGKRYDPAMGAEAQRLSKSRTLRVTGPGQAVTMDYRLDRPNIDLDENDIVQRVSCG